MKCLANVIAVVAGIVIVSAVSILVSVQNAPISFPGIPEDQVRAEVGALGFPGVSAQNYQYIYQQDKNTLSVTGTAIVSTSPNKVDVYLGAETESTTALQSQQDNAQIMQDMRNALSGIGYPVIQ